MDASILWWPALVGCLHWTRCGISSIRNGNWPFGLLSLAAAFVTVGALIQFRAWAFSWLWS